MTINNRDYIIKNLWRYNLKPEEFMLLMIIDYMEETNIHYDLNHLSNLTKLKKIEIENIIEELIYNKLLTMIDEKLIVTIDYNNGFKDIIDVFQDEFKRPLTNCEISIIQKWKNKYEEKLIIYALIEASIRNVYNLNYVKKILENWEVKGITAIDYEGGKR